MLPMMPMSPFGQTVVPYNLGDHVDTIPEALAFMVAGLLQKVRTVEEEKSKLQGVINSHEATISGNQEAYRELRQEVNDLKKEPDTLRAKHSGEIHAMHEQLAVLAKSLKAAKQGKKL